MTPAQVKASLLRHAARLGFGDCRVARADFLEEEAAGLEKWLAQGHHGSMAYLANHFDKRLDPRLLVPGAQTVISLRYNYFPGEGPSDGSNPSEKEAHKNPQKDAAPKIARYAYGEDYHRVVKDQLYALMDAWQEEVGPVEGRCFVDSAPVMERAWARRSGLGWVGKNSLVLTKGVGSYYFLAEWIVDRPLPPDPPVTDHCGSCTRCLDACPTGALIQPGVLDSNRCISHATIELHAAVPNDLVPKLSGWTFGCDICQEVCPWNRHATPHHEPRFSPESDWATWTEWEWKSLTDETFRSVFGKTPMMRAGFAKWKQSAALALGWERDSAEKSSD